MKSVEPCALSRARSRSARSGARAQAGSVRAASPVSAKAWQRHPPQSISRRSQERHGSGIQAVPRKRLNASERYQMSARLSLITEGKMKPGKVSAARSEEHTSELQSRRE